MAKNVSKKKFHPFRDEIPTQLSAICFKDKIFPIATNAFFGFDSFITQKVIIQNKNSVNRSF